MSSLDDKLHYNYAFLKNHSEYNSNIFPKYSTMEMASIKNHNSDRLKHNSHYRSNSYDKNVSSYKETKRKLEIDLENFNVNLIALKQKLNKEKSNIRLVRPIKGDYTLKSFMDEYTSDRNTNEYDEDNEDHFQNTNFNRFHSLQHRKNPNIFLNKYDNNTRDYQNNQQHFREISNNFPINNNFNKYFSMTPKNEENDMLYFNIKHNKNKNTGKYNNFNNYTYDSVYNNYMSHNNNNYNNNNEGKRKYKRLANNITINDPYMQVFENYNSLNNKNKFIKDDQNQIPFGYDIIIKKKKNNEKDRIYYLESTESENRKDNKIKKSSKNLNSFRKDLYIQDPCKNYETYQSIRENNYNTFNSEMNNRNNIKVICNNDNDNERPVNIFYKRYPYNQNNNKINDKQIIKKNINNYYKKEITNNKINQNNDIFSYKNINDDNTYKIQELYNNYIEDLDTNSNKNLHNNQNNNNLNRINTNNNDNINKDDNINNINYINNINDNTNTYNKVYNTNNSNIKTNSPNENSQSQYKNIRHYKAKFRAVKLYPHHFSLDILSSKRSNKQKTEKPLTNKDKIIVNLKKKVKELKKMISDQNEFYNHLNQNQNFVAECNNQIKEKESIITNKDNKILELNLKIKNLEFLLEKQELLYGKFTDEKPDLKKEVQKKDKAIIDLTKELVESEKIIEENSSKKLNERTKLNNKLKDTEKIIKKLNKELEDFKCKTFTRVNLNKNNNINNTNKKNNIDNINNINNENNINNKIIDINNNNKNIKNVTKNINDNKDNSNSKINNNTEENLDNKKEDEVKKLKQTLKIEKTNQKTSRNYNSNLTPGYENKNLISVISKVNKTDKGELNNTSTSICNSVDKYSTRPTAPTKRNNFLNNTDMNNNNSNKNISISNNMNYSNNNNIIYNNVNDLNNIKVDNNYVITNKTLLTIYPNEEGDSILCFEPDTKQFILKALNDLSNFKTNYKKAYKLGLKNLYLTYNMDLYIVSGPNADKFFIYHSDTNTVSKLCTLKNNHSMGSLIYFKGKIFCISGEHNKKVEVYFISKNLWLSINELNTERASCGLCIIKDRYLVACFGYNKCNNQFLNTIEYFDLMDNENSLFINKWNILKYKNEDNINLYMAGMIPINYNNQKIIFLGGICERDSNNYKSIDEFSQIILGNDFIKDSKVIKTNRYLKDMNKNKNGYCFEKGFSIYTDENNRTFYQCFDYNHNAHIIELNNLVHDIIYIN